MTMAAPLRATNPSSLLERAKAVERPGRIDYGHEDCELALALLMDDVNPTQAATAWNISKRSGGTQTYCRAFCALRAAYRAGLLKFEMTE